MPDFAHCDHLPARAGAAARYVSGYLLTYRRLAWRSCGRRARILASVAPDSAGHFDPNHGSSVGDHITFAYGLLRDVSPISGILPAAAVRRWLLRGF